MKLRLEHNPHGKGWWFQFTPFKRGAGYMAYVFPWHSRSIHAPRWRTRAWVSYIPGYSLDIVRNAIEMNSTKGHWPTRRKRTIAMRWTSNGHGRKVYPGWWT